MTESSNSFQRSKLSEYSTDQLQDYRSTLDARAQQLSAASAHFNDLAGQALNNRALSSTEKLAHGNYYGLRRDVAQEMGHAVAKDVAAIDVELAFR
ncbi:UNVERIFIED_ORG: hypothetical protein J2X79_003760 [Arthrobacter globiformis]|nr:hypothetical protein [Arthrobacter globiformis]